MAEEQEGGSRFGDLLNSIDAASRKLEGKIKDRVRKNPEGGSPDDAPEIEHVTREEDALPVVDSDSCLLYTSPSPRDRQKSRMPSSA